MEHVVGLVTVCAFFLYMLEVLGLLMFPHRVEDMGMSFADIDDAQLLRASSTSA